MPYRSEKIKIAGTIYDRRAKLTAEEREEIKYLYQTSVHNQRKLAAMFHVSRSLIAMIVNPERLKRSSKLLKERKREGRYGISKEERARIIREHRRYKQRLFVEGKIQNSMKNEQEKERRDF